MIPKALNDWLTASGFTDISESPVVNQDQAFPLVGRDGCIKLIAQCFIKAHEYRTCRDQSRRPIPVCVGGPGLGKTRLLEECSRTILDMTGIPGKRLEVIISFGKDGNASSWIDEHLGIQCLFAWRVLHAIFKSRVTFEEWMCCNSPSNRSHLTLGLVLLIVDYHWKKSGGTGDVLLFVGVDEYQKLGDVNFNLLLDTLCNSSCISESSCVTLFCLLTGTDVTMTRAAYMSHPGIENISIQFLTHGEAIDMIVPFILKRHPNFVISNKFAKNVYYLGGVPGLLTQFAKKLSQMNEETWVEEKFQKAQNAILIDFLNLELSVSDTLKLLAFSFTNTPVKNLLFCPFGKLALPFAQNISWNDLISAGMCLIQEDGRVIVPYFVIPQVLERQENEQNVLGEYEVGLMASLKELLSVIVSSPDSLVRFSPQSFDAHFYCVRINSFLVLGYNEVSLSDILRGSQLNSAFLDSTVHIRVANVLHSNEQYGPDLSQFIVQKNTDNIPSDLFDGRKLQVVLNGDGES
ncbi:hypothetical protein HDU99_005265, partial [Rhizoclosmatium hyalinum]